MKYSKEQKRVLKLTGGDSFRTLKTPKLKVFIIKDGFYIVESKINYDTTLL
jgi:hypothetical protein